jgi:staphylococcal nuclease domain-containing protein 1
MASKANANIDEPGAFSAREFLREMVVGKFVNFETRKQGASAGDRVYGLLTFAETQGAEPTNLAEEVVRNGFATPKAITQPTKDDDEGDGDEYKKSLLAAYDEARQARVGIHSEQPLVRKLKNSGDDYQMLSLVQNSQKLGDKGRIKCVIEYIFDGSRYRVQVTDPLMGDMQYSSFTLLLAGVASPRLANTRVDPPIRAEECSEDARMFVELRVLQRELEISLHGTDKSGSCGVASIHHPKGNIAVELLKNGLAKMSDWSVRMMSPLDVPALRIAENNAKRTNTGVWHAYTAPQLKGASQISGTVVEVISGDTVSILPDGQAYDSEDKLVKISLASVRAPRVGNERAGRADEAYSHDCKDRLRVLTVGKPCTVQVHYEREIPIGPTPENRQFGTISVKNKPDVGEALITEGLATTQFHKDGEVTSPRYDELRAAEAIAKAAKKGLHSEAEYKKKAQNDLSDPKKAKAYSGSLMRAGKLKAIVEYCFNGARFKMLLPSENCHIMFAPTCLRCPQPTSNPGSRVTKAAEPFGDSSKRHARLTVLQRTVEIDCNGVTMGGVITGSMFVGTGAQRRDYSLELVGSGLATVDQRKIDYGEAPKQLVDAQAAAQQNRVGLWSVDRVSDANPVKSNNKLKDQVSSIRISEIRSGTHFFYHVVNDEASKVVEDSMKSFTTNNGTAGAPCDVKVSKVVAALFDDGAGKSWYRAKIVEKLSPAKVKVLFIDHGNVADIPVSTHLRPLDMSLGTDRIPPVAKEGTLALTLTQPLSEDSGLDAARMFQSACWGKDLAVRIHGTDDTGRVAVVITTDSGETLNEQMVSAGLARVENATAVNTMAGRMSDRSAVLKLAADLNVAQEAARKSRSGMWRYGDIGDDDDEQI